MKRFAILSAIFFSGCTAHASPYRENLIMVGDNWGLHQFVDVPFSATDYKTIVYLSFGQLGEFQFVRDKPLNKTMVRTCAIGALLLFIASGALLLRKRRP